VDATFGHRIDPKEVTAFDKAVEHNELVTPPAGTVGRGDGFVLSIAQKVGASILSNDSFQEFHVQYEWLFDEGRLIGGKPVPNVGWVFVNRTPVRGEKSRRAMRESQPTSDKPGKGVAKVKLSAEAMKPMPVPKSLPPGATLPAKKVDRSKSVNDILPFLQFVEKNTVGSVVVGIVESYSSHGAYVTLGDVRGYVPLRLLGSPPPRSAREVMQLGESVTLEIVQIIAGRRSIDLVPTTKSVSEVASKSKSKAAAKKAAPAKKAASVKKAAPAKKDASVKKAKPIKKAVPVKKVAPIKKAAPAKKAAPVKKAVPVKKVTPVKKATPAKKVVAKKVATKAAPRRK